MYVYKETIEIRLLNGCGSIAVIHKLWFLGTCLNELTHWEINWKQVKNCYDLEIKEGFENERY